ncbi:hypothetical protein [Candidatus Solincola tengchongensis]|uniref:hypothetical protein n=1 Tax=Candidatus Solincola tengchongensis TaxID=2900693 RepID=UPI00257EABBC|nr:hypothetical protein [Candidatus Solincola tengchongensis]
MSGRYRLSAYVVPMILAIAALMLFPGCGEKTEKEPAPGKAAGRPQVVNFWQPG